MAGPLKLDIRSYII